MKLELVIARYMESLDWLFDPEIQQYLLHFPGEIVFHIYNKGDSENISFESLQNIYTTSVIYQESLPNVGCEAHTYLYHIVHHYNHLADMTLFLPGSSSLSYKLSRVKRTVEQACLRKDSYFYANRATLPSKFHKFTIQSWKYSHERNQTNNPETELIPAFYRPFSVWYAKMFPELRTIHGGVLWNSIFAVSNTQLHKHTKEYYEKFLEQLLESSQLEVVHFIERAWFAIFYPIPKENIEYY
jgi:hypothetical protein